MDEKSLSHTSWNCKYHIVLVPKYRRKTIYGKLRKDIGKILRMLCDYKHVEIIEAHAMPDHIHMLLSIPPKLAVADFMGYLKGKSTLMIFERHVLRLMNHLGIRKKEFDAVPQTEIAKAVYEEAPAEGYWFPEVCAGQEVLKDELLGRWKSSDGTQNYEVRARFAGQVLYETTALGVRRNDLLVAYGTA